MYRFLIEDIITKINTELPEFKTVRLFNDDFNKLDQGVIDTFAKPALLIGFPEGVNYTDAGSKVQKTETLVLRFYIAKDMTRGRASNNTTILDLFDLKQKVYNTFQGYKSSGFNTFKRRYEETDEDRTNYYIFIQDWTTDVVDDTKYVNGGGVEIFNLGLDLNSDLVINPDTKIDGNGIRTAKNVDNG